MENKKKFIPDQSRRLTDQIRETFKRYQSYYFSVLRIHLLCFLKSQHDILNQKKPAEQRLCGLCIPAVRGKLCENVYSLSW